MAEVIFESVSSYLGTCTSNQAKIAALDAVITSMLDAAATAATSGHLDEYWYDDGHVKIRTKYRTVDQINKAITGLEQLKNMYINRIGGRVVRLMDGKNFMGWIR